MSSATNDFITTFAIFQPTFKVELHFYRVYHFYLPVSHSGFIHNLKSLVLAAQQGESRRTQLVLSVQKRQLHHEKILHHFGSCFGNQFSCCAGTSACGQDVVHNHNISVFGDHTLSDLENIAAVLLLELGRQGRARQLSWFSHWNETSTQGQGQSRAEKEASALQAHNVVDFCSLQVQLESIHQFLEQVRFGKNRQEVLEKDTLLREVGESLQRRLQFFGDCGNFAGHS
ncbi:hypothetical protein CLUG_03281 [Clavispora lusitaniae ATCC 42720]|uniref:Uncharacterized protein n=1 Tax=Clavispora lusitaniae (strain ATCC 42720) TaxID=306902 RepID=C4Y547_CLAL4|nr:uncharacterized protein CLUG_03281 [Clavispora lusitaniae ATCC 42720]EEQ39153.1 hypothetical protein CLUG_03281 [Clavispora lusitaniae ATCC 42720]